MKQYINTSLLFLFLCIYTPTFILAKNFSDFCKENKTTIICSGAFFILGLYICNKFINNTDSSIKGNGNITTEEMDFSNNITELKINNIANVLVYYNENKSYVQTITDENIQEHALPFLINDSLNLGINSNESCSPTKLIYHLYLQNPELIKEITTSGSSQFNSQNISFTNENFSIKTSGSSKTIIYSLNNTNLNIQTQGSSDLEINSNSNTTNLNIKTNGSSTIKASNLNANEKTIIDSNGSSSILLGNLGTTKISTNGSSSIDIKKSEQVIGTMNGASIINIPSKTKINIKNNGASKVKTK